MFSENSNAKGNNPICDCCPFWALQTACSHVLTSHLKTPNKEYCFGIPPHRQATVADETRQNHRRQVVYGRNA